MADVLCKVGDPQKACVTRLDEGLPGWIQAAAGQCGPAMPVSNTGTQAGSDGGGEGKGRGAMLTCYRVATGRICFSTT